MAAKQKPSPKTNVRSLKGVGVLVTGATAREVRRAMNLLKVNKGPQPTSKETKMAVNLYRMTKKFFRLGGRFKKPFTRKKTGPKKQ